MVNIGSLFSRRLQADMRINICVSANTFLSFGLVNDGSTIYDPTVSPDGKMLYFTSTRVRGYYKRDPATLPMDYDALLKEMNGIFNGKGNIFMIAIHPSGATS